MSENHQKIGYARVSTTEQNLDSQRDALDKAGCFEIYAEKLSGKDTERPEFKNCLRALRPGDTLVIWALDRLGRNLKELVLTVDDLQKKGVLIESLTDKIKTDTANDTFNFHITAVFAEFERNKGRERTNAGLAAARARGRKGGRKPSLDAKQIKEILVLLSDPDITVIDVAKRYGVARSTVYNHVGAVVATKN